MLATKSRSLKNFFPPIHEPPSIDRKNADKILSGLVSSFNRALDNEYGPLPTQSTLAAGRPTSPATIHTPLKYKPPRYQQLADRHMNALLANPLLSYSPKARTPGLGRDPMDVFDEAVSKGMMTEARAHGCLAAKMKELDLSSAPSLLPLMRESGAGLRVTRWLQSSGADRDLQFLRPISGWWDRSFQGLLLRFMVAEGLEETAWGWFSRLIRSEDNTLWARARLLLWLMVRSQWAAGFHTTAYESIFRAESMIASLKAPISETSSTTQPARLNDVLLSPWRFISWRATMGHWYHGLESSHTGPPSESEFKHFIQLGRKIRVRWDLHNAHLNLHHPTHPRANSAVEFLRERIGPGPGRYHIHIDPQPRTVTPNVLLTGRVACMGLEAVNHLVSQEDRAQSMEVFELLKQRLAPLFDSIAEWDGSKLLQLPSQLEFMGLPETRDLGDLYSGPSMRSQSYQHEPTAA